MSIVLLATAVQWKRPINDSENFLRRILSCFCLRKNWFDLIKNDPKQSLTFSAMKLGPLGVLACGHAFSGLSSFSVIDPYELENSVHRTSAELVRGWGLFLPLFFLVGGYFTSFKWIKNILKGNVDQVELQILRSLVRRLVRLVPSLAFVIFFFATTMSTYYSHPRWFEVVGNERANCRENGWLNILFMSNIFRTKDAVRFCRFYFKMVWVK